MICAIYKSNKILGSYLYMPTKAKFNDLPETLIQHFGIPKLVMLFNLAGEKKLAKVENQQVIEQINKQGYYLQIVKLEDNLLEQYKKQQNSKL